MAERTGLVPNTCYVFGLERERKREGLREACGGDENGAWKVESKERGQCVDSVHTEGACMLASVHVMY